MKEKEKAAEIYDDFILEYEKTIEMLVDTYPRVSRVKKDKDLSENVFKIVIYSVLLNTLKQLQIDSTKLSLNEFHTKYVPNLPILYRGDFTCNEFAEIIEETYLKERDKKIAYKYFVEKKSVSDIYSELKDVSDQKTINNNLETINDALLHRACIYNKEKH